MKVSIVLCLVGALLVQDAAAFLPFGRPLIGPVGWPIGFPFGPFGFGGFPFGPFGGLGLFGRGFGGFGFGFRRFVGKRDADMGLMANETELFNTNKTVCSYIGEKSMLSCVGFEHNFDCEAKLQSYKFDKQVRLANLEIVPAVEGKFDLLRIFARNSNDSFTLVEPETKKQVVLSLYNSEKINEPGFWIKDSNCWSQIERMIKSTNQTEINLGLFINQ